MADEQKIDSREAALQLDALTALIDKNIVPSAKGRTAPDAPRDPMAAAANDLASCATKATDDTVLGLGKISHETIQHLDQQNLNLCIESFARNVVAASESAANSLPNNSGKGGVERK